jgi:RNA polymerase sporulation-specific sigma factor
MGRGAGRIGPGLSAGVGQPYPFDKFAVLCIRRHLSTLLKSSFQNKKKTLNMSLSLDQDRGSHADENLFLSDVVPKTDETVVESVGDREYYNKLFAKLKKYLSPLEQRVFILYTYKYSYEEISAILDEYYKRNKIRKRTNVKGIDNALSRIKQKAKLVYKRYKE